MNDIDWEEWEELTEDQQDAILEREMKSYHELLNSKTLPEQIAHHRSSILETCLRWRKLMRDFSFLRQYLRRSQIQLLKLRIWRTTGQYPGEG